MPTQPGGAPSLLLGGGKVGTLYAVKIASMGHQRKKNPNVQAIVNPSDPIFSSPAYYNGNVYINAVGDVLRQYKIENGKLVGPVAVSSESFGYPGANLSISADGSSDGIVWSLENSGTRAVPAPPCSTPTTPRTWAKSSTTATRPELATSRATPSSSPFRPSPTARSTWGRRPA